MFPKTLREIGDCPVGQLSGRENSFQRKRVLFCFYKISYGVTQFQQRDPKVDETYNWDLICDGWSMGDVVVQNSQDERLIKDLKGKSEE